MSKTVDIIIINWNTRDLLENLLFSIDKHASNVSMRTIVSDNGSTDGSVEMVKMRFPNVEVIENGANLGYSAAANEAIGISESDYIFLLNSDTQIYEETINKLISFMDQHSKAGAVGPMLVNSDGSLQYSCRRFPNIWMGSFHAVLGLIWKNNPYTRDYKMQNWDHQSLRQVDWISGAAMFIRRSAIDEIGLFDERYFMYVEDVDLCRRLSKAGWQVFYYPKSVVLHHIGKSSEKRTSRMIIEHHRSIYRFFRKQSRNVWGWFFAPFLAMGLTVRAIAVIISNWRKR